MIKNRYLKTPILEDLTEKMVFIGGARQVGKTTLSKNIIGATYNRTEYYNWDKKSHRKAIIQSKWPGDSDLIILDEIHKYKKWKSLVKGEYDTLKEKYHFIITGSSRLDLYRKDGDSMQGRYHYYRLHPFSLAESAGINPHFKIFKELPIPSKDETELFHSLYKFGGFPEPFTKQSERSLRRWHNEKNNRLFREDIRDLEQIRDLSNMQLLGDILSERVASLLSINSIRKDIEVSHRAVSNWIKILETFYYCYRIYPFVGKNYRSLKKDAKLYLWDWSEIEDEPKRFENMIGSHLLKLAHFLQDYEGYKAILYFLRNVDKKEVDFFMTIDGKPWFSVEVKINETKISPHLNYFKEKLNIPFSYQVIKKSGVDIFSKGVRVISADRFLAGLI